jgi:predicted HicB family RNase H-like nuclease
MGAKYTVSQQKATEKYMHDKHVLRVVVSKEKAEAYKKIAKDSNKSLNQFVIDCINKYIEEMNLK